MVFISEVIGKNIAFEINESKVFNLKGEINLKLTNLSILNDLKEEISDKLEIEPINISLFIKPLNHLSFLVEIEIKLIL